MGREAQYTLIRDSVSNTCEGTLERGVGERREKGTKSVRETVRDFHNTEVKGKEGWSHIHDGYSHIKNQEPQCVNLRP